jgi:hypothetical protein
MSFTAMPWCAWRLTGSNMLPIISTKFQDCKADLKENFEIYTKVLPKIADSVCFDFCGVSALLN